MWFKMILESFKDQTSRDNPVEYFMHQFSLRKDVFSSTFFFSRSKERAVSLQKAFEQILSNNNKLPGFYSDITEQVYKCEFVFGYDPSVEFAILTEDKKLLIDLRDFDNIIKGLESLISKSSNETLAVSIKNVQKVKVSARELNNSSFTYLNLERGLSDLTDLKNSLRRRNLISKDTKLSSFRKVFMGGEIEESIVWVGLISELWYFITQLHHELKYVENLKLKVWTVALNCFVQKDGKPYERNKIKNQKVPATSIFIDKALATLNLPSALSRN